MRYTLTQKVRECGPRTKREKRIKIRKSKRAEHTVQTEGRGKTELRGTWPDWLLRTDGQSIFEVGASFAVQNQRPGGQVVKTTQQQETLLWLQYCFLISIITSRYHLWYHSRHRRSNNSNSPYMYCIFYYHDNDTRYDVITSSELARTVNKPLILWIFSLFLYESGEFFVRFHYPCSVSPSSLFAIGLTVIPTRMHCDYLCMSSVLLANKRIRPSYTPLPQ